MRKTLKAAGVNLGSLPVDDCKAMTQLRHTVKSAARRTPHAARRTKLVKARDSVIDYQLAHSALNSTGKSLQEEKGEWR